MATKNIRYRISETGAERTSRNMGKLDKSTQGLVSSAAKLAVTYFSARGVIDGMRKINELAGRASQIDSMAKAMQRLADTSGFSGDTFQKLNAAVDGTVNELELLRQANNAMILGIADSNEQLAEMFDGAQRLARALGRDALYGIESFVTGVGRQSRLMLDNLGIIVEAEKAYETFAAQIGKTTAQLTDQEKKTAFTQAAVEALNDAVARLGEEELTARDESSQLSVAINNLGTNIGTLFSPAVRTGTKILTSFVGVLNDGLELLNKAGGFISLFDRLFIWSGTTGGGAGADGGFAAQQEQVLAQVQAATQYMEEQKRIVEEVAAAEQRRLDAAVQYSEVTFEQYRQARQAFIEEQEFLRNIEDELEQITEQELERNQATTTYDSKLTEVDATTRAMISHSRQMGNAIVNALLTGQSAGEAFLQTLLQIGSQLLINTGLNALFPGAGLLGFGQLFGGSFATGTDFVSSSDGFLRYHANERVTVQPLNQSTSNDNSRNITINVQGDVLDMDRFIVKQLSPAMDRLRQQGHI